MSAESAAAPLMTGGAACMYGAAGEVGAGAPAVGGAGAAAAGAAGPVPPVRPPRPRVCRLGHPSLTWPGRRA
ncbi:hypothetical protein, partial [Mycobacterium cookii]|uniref:hypothetical protein n=1 Tax=Mycobacterium cookii TaxID=1775 RepID=UPI0021F33355